MNLFAVNAAEVNGSIEVWSWYGDAALAVNGSGEVALGLVAGGDADMVTAGSLAPRLDVYGSFTSANVAANASGDMMLGLTVSGDAQAQVTASGSGLRWTFGESQTEIVLEAEGEGQAVAPAAASFNIVVSTSLDGMVATTVIENGLGHIVLDGLLNEHVAKRQLIEGEAQVHLASVGQGYLIIEGPAGESAIQMLADGEARLGAKIDLEGDATLQVFARGALGSLHYEYGEGAAIIVVQAGAAMAGIPEISAEYVQAPRARTIIVQRDRSAVAYDCNLDEAIARIIDSGEYRVTSTGQMRTIRGV